MVIFPEDGIELFADGPLVPITYASLGSMLA